MTLEQQNRGGAPVGFLTELGVIEAASVIYLRLWWDGPDSRAQVRRDLASSLGVKQGRAILNSFEQLCDMCVRHGRRPLMRHCVQCKCIGSDESCFANFIAAAAEGAREDAMLIATLLVRPDMAPAITNLATEFGLGLKRMRLSAPRDLARTEPSQRILH